jgi:hypothetical protein
MRGRSRAGFTPAKALRAPRRRRRRMPPLRRLRRRRAGRLRRRRSRGLARRAVPSRVTRRPVSRRERRSRSVVPRPNPTSPATRGASVKNGFTPTGSRRGKSRNDLVGDPNTDVVGVAPVPAPAARPHPLPAPRPPRVHATGAPYAPPGYSEGYGQGGYAAAPQMDMQAAYSPLLVALMQAMRGGYA